ncbi:MAG: tetratricopeptide repeat protein [Desulfobacteraceae bacterium]
MTEEQAKRKLTAILSADVKAYSRLMADDEEATVRTINVYREVVTRLINEHRGRVVDAKGDNVLAEFSSVVDALRCAVEIQEELGKRNDELPENRRMEFRIGINLGDVIEEKETIYGDGVNIAARLEALADGRGVCISGTAFDQIGKKLPIGYEYLGEQTVKNIEKPVRAYKVLMEPEYVGKVIGEERPKPKHWRWAAIGGVVALVVVAAALAIWTSYFRPAFEPASEDRMAFPLPEKPSIAVLPFDNMSGDAEQDYIADGFTQNIITGLSQIPEMFVIARNSVFTYKGKPVKVKQVSEELGVRYVLEGSIQKAGDQLRVTAQLIDALEGDHLWAERYDRELKDLFKVQDEITIKILKALRMKLVIGGESDWNRADNFEAWNHFAKGLSYADRMTREDRKKAREHYEQALKLDPDYTAAWMMLAFTHVSDVMTGLSESPRDSIKRALEISQKTSERWPESYRHTFMNMIYSIQGQLEKAIAEGEKAIALDPNDPRNHILLATALNARARPEEAIVYAKKAMRLEPYYPAWFLGDVLAVSYDQVGRYEEGPAIGKELLKRALKGEYPLKKAHRRMALIYVRLGMMEEARAHAAEFLKIDPNFSVEKWRRSPKLSVFKDQEWLDSVAEGLRKAGLPEIPPLPLPDKPSIAVLPFENMSGDPEQEYFSDGISEEIITALSKTPKMFVIARNSTFTYKGKPVKVQQVGRELGVKYVLEGSVRKAEDQVRIAAQLVDAQTGHHLWAERYDRELKDIFALQDEITMKIITAMGVRLTAGEESRLYAKGTENLDAYLKFLEGREHIFRFNKDDNLLARQRAEEAMALDPEYSNAYALLGKTYILDVWFKWSKSPKESLTHAFELAKKALALDESNIVAHRVLSHIYLLKRQHDKAIAESERAVSLAPNAADELYNLGVILRFSGRAKEAISMQEKAIRLNPLPPASYLYQLGLSYTFIGEFEKAIAICKKALRKNPDDLVGRITLAIAHSSLGRKEEARAEAAEVLRIHPKFSLEYASKTWPYKNQADRDLVIGALRKVGLK